MKKIFTLFITLVMLLSSSLQAKDWTWAEDIARLNPEVVDSVIPIINPIEDYKWYQSCMIYYHQPLKHDNPSLGNVSLRALFTIYSFEKFEDRMVQMHIGGYQLDELAIEEPNTGFADNASFCAQGEISYRYEGSLLRPEHRFFGASCPENPMEKIEYCNAKEAAADFHALAEAVKKVFKGKWVISGVSKGGMCAAIQQAYYPDDADFFVPYVAPIMTSACDMRIQERSMTEPWTAEMREDMRHLVSEILNRPEVYNYYIEKKRLGAGRETQERCAFLADTYDILAEAQQLMLRSTVADIFEYNKSYLKENGLDDYSDAMLAYILMSHLTKLGDFESWEKKEWNKESQSETPPSDDDDDSSDFDFDFSDLDDDPTDDDTVTAREFARLRIGFFYQSLRELGYYGIKWDYFYDTQAKIDSVNALWQSFTINPIDLNYRYRLGKVEYDPELMNLVRQQTANATKPMLFIYGGDDYWTGGRIQDEYVNNKNVRYYILPAQNHDACMYFMTETDMQDEIWAFLDSVLRDTPNAIEQIELPASAKSRYNLFGQPADEAQGFVVRDGQVVFVK